MKHQLYIFKYAFDIACFYLCVKTVCHNFKDCLNFKYVFLPRYGSTSVCVKIGSHSYIMIFWNKN